MSELEYIDYPKEIPMKLMVVNMDSSCPHWHWEYELYFVLKGKLKIHKSDGSFLVKAGDLILLNSEEIHSMQAVDGDNISLFLQFSPDLIKQVYPASFDFDINTVSNNPPSKEKVKNLQQILARMALLIIEKPDGYQFSLTSDMYLAIASLFHDFRYTPTSNSEKDSSKETLEDFEAIQKYVTSNFKTDIKESDMCHQIGMSRTKVYEVMKAADMDSFRSLINYYRIEYAKKQLSNTKDPISLIASESGFVSDSSFFRAFKSLTGISPNAYRDKPKNDKPDYGAIQGYIPYSSSEAERLLKQYLK